MADNDKLVTKQGLRDFYNQIRPYLNGGANIGYTPIGTIISLMGKSAPKHYLQCDGTIYNIVDYQELADYFENEFGANNYFGGNGTTTFAVPDLRGEFLRGTGTNSHANQGNGSDVGVHQNATQHINFTTGSGNLNYGTVSVSNPDKSLSSGARNYIAKTGAAGSEAIRIYTARPTNTSVLYCIATKDIYIDAKYDYSTTEKVVGTWVDGKPLYQKTIDVGAMPNNTTKTVASGLINENVVNMFGYTAHTNGVVLPLPYVDISSNSTVQIHLSYLTETHSIRLMSGADRSTFSSGYVTLQYTKTTD